MIEAYQSREDLKFHLEWIKNYQSIIEQSSSIKAAVLVGSFAKGNPDRISDIDLIAFSIKNQFEQAS